MSQIDKVLKKALIEKEILKIMQILSF